MYRLPAVAFLFCLSAFSADQVALTNGDLISGSIIQKDATKLILKTEMFGELTIPWTKVKSLHGDSAELVHLFASDIPKQKVQTGSEELLIVTTAGTAPAQNIQIEVLRSAEEKRKYDRQEHPRVFDLWQTNVDIGLALARGNARTDTFTTAMVANRTTSTDKINIFLNQIYGTARVNNIVSATASDIRGGWTYNRNLTPRFFISTMNNYEHDRFQNLDLRVVGGVGAGWNAVKRESFNFALLAGADYNRENYFDNLHRNFAEMNIGDTLTFKMTKSSTLNQAFQLFNNVSDTGNYRATFDLSWVTDIRRWLAWHVTASDHYLSNPVLGSQRNDLLMSTGLRLTFAR